MLRKISRIISAAAVCLLCCVICRLDVQALTIEYDEEKQEIIISGVPESNQDYFYNMYGNLKYKGERVESFCYGMPGAPYDIPSAQAYIFTYEDHEFIMPGSGTYVITAWIETIDCSTGEDLGRSQQTDHPYTWTINGADVYNVPGEGEKVNLQINSITASSLVFPDNF